MTDPRLAALPALRRLAEEEWRPLPGWIDTHEVSNYGRVRALARVVVDSSGRSRFLPERLLSLSAVHGYPTAMLYFEGRTERVRVHRATLRAFVGEPTEGQIARHLDGNRANGHVSNLAWGTYEENMSDARRHGTLCIGERNGGAVLTESDIVDMFSSFTVQTPPETLAARYGVSAGTICDALRGKSWSHITPTPAVEQYRALVSAGHWTATRAHRKACGPQSGAARHPEKYQGSRNGRAKLDEVAVVRIRSLLESGGSDKEVAARFGVSDRTISHIRAGRTWRNTTSQALA